MAVVRYRFGDMTKQIFRNEHQRCLSRPFRAFGMPRIKDLVVKEVVSPGERQLL